MTREEKVRERLNDLVTALFDAADAITSVENNGAGNLENVFSEVRWQVWNINEKLDEVLDSYLDADRDYNLHLHLEEEEEAEDIDGE